MKKLMLEEIMLIAGGIHCYCIAGDENYDVLVGDDKQAFIGVVL